MALNNGQTVFGLKKISRDRWILFPAKVVSAAGKSVEVTTFGGVFNKYLPQSLTLYQKTSCFENVDDAKAAQKSFCRINASENCTCSFLNIFFSYSNDEQDDSIRLCVVFKPNVEEKEKVLRWISVRAAAAMGDENTEYALHVHPEIIFRGAGEKGILDVIVV